MSVTSKRTIASVITDTDFIAPGQPFHAALRLRLAPGWHTYWQNPGDAGIPPDIALMLSPGAQFGPLEWPVPVRVAEGSLTTYAYTGDVVLPFTVTPGGGALTIAAHAEWLSCRDVCVPEEAQLDLSLPVGSPAPSVEATLIAAARASTPAPAPFEATVTPGGQLTLIDAAPRGEVASAEFLPLQAGVVEKAAAQPPRGEGDRLILPIDPGQNAVAQPGVVVLTTRSGAVNAYTVLPKLVSEAQPPPRLLPLLLLALAGGLLLNLMPCVFPILAMKAMAVARLAGADGRRLRAEAASYTAGVLVAFVGLGAALVTLRSAGSVAGWGFQFQSPSFVTGMAWVLFALGLSLSGVFEIGGGLMGRGDALARKGGHSGSFLTGMLAVVVASPCTAPFMGTAIAGALALSTTAALAVFAALGLGLALPYAAVAVVPSLSQLLPRPGPWMRTLQQLLAFPMYAACVWLVWVVSQQAGSTGVLAACAGVVAVGFGGWAVGVAQHCSSWGRHVARGSALAAMVALAALLYATRPGLPNSIEAAEPFTTARLEQLRSQGRPVFVNMTASWCLSCLVNERVALSPVAVQNAFAHANVAYLKGDWTSQNPAISAYLHQLGQDGVPSYVLYAPGRSPVILPQLLSEGTVLDALANLRS